jgi:hypothetical protein
MIIKRRMEEVRHTRDLTIALTCVIRSLST